MWQLIQSESKKLFRDARLYAGAALLVFLLWYGFSSRHQALQIQQITADSLLTEQQKKFNAYTLLLDSVIKGQKEVKSYAQDPRNPVYYSQRLPLVAQLPQKELGILATGQSDLYNEQMTLNLRFRDPRIQKQDMSNPLLLQFGPLDAALVVVVLLPLFIIALSFNFLSAEKENGTLALIAVQSGAVKKWILAKTILYGAIVFLISWFTCTFFLLLYKAPILQLAGGFFNFSLLLLGYVFFWQLLAVWVNSFGKTSAFNALALITAWLFFVYILPASVNLLATQVHKVPSRVSFINTLRIADVEAERIDSSKLVDQFYYDHPELAEKKDTTGQSRYAENAFWKEIVVQQEYINKKAEPVYEQYNRQLQTASGFAGKTIMLSPSGIFYKGLTSLAGTSTEDYQSFNDAAMNYRSSFLAITRDKILTDKEMTLAEVKNQPGFTYTSSDNATSWLLPLIILLYSVLIVFFLFKKTNSMHVK